MLNLMTGCSGGGSEETQTDESGATVIKFGIHVANPAEQETVTYNIVEAFNKANDGKYKVEFEAADTETHSKNMKLKAEDGTLPQIFWIEGSEASEYSEAGVLMDLTEFLEENVDIKTALGGMEAAFKDNNGQFGLPYQCNVQGIFYNKELFDKSEIAYPTDETTYEDFVEMIKKLKDSGVTPLAIGSKNSAFAMWEFNEFLARYGWEDNIENILGGSDKFNNKELIACFEKFQGLKDAGAFPENMFFIDGEEYPSLNGTGTEDYFNHAWGMQRNAYPFFGTIVHEGDTDGFQVSYRFHITDPVRFEKSLRVTIEHGHANHLSDDWSSTAYWYQTLPTEDEITILPVEERLPNVPKLPERNLKMPELTEEMKAARQSWEKRWEEYAPAREEQFRIKEKKARRESRLNTEFAKKLRDEYK